MVGSLLFLCTKNAIRSPMAEGLAKAAMAAGNIPALPVNSAGIDPGDVDGFAVSVMAELGLDLQNHQGQGLDTVARGEYDLVIALSDAAAQAALPLVKGFAAEVERWHVPDPSTTEGNRETQLAAYRQTRDYLKARIADRFAL